MHVALFVLLLGVCGCDSAESMGSAKEFMGY